MRQVEATRPLSMRIGEESYTFETRRSFEFALSGRTGLPATKLATLLGANDDMLLREAEGIRRVEQKLVGIISGTIEDITSIGGFMVDLDLSVVSQDHDWREIMNNLRSLGTDFEDYKRIALVKYIQYLTARQEVIRAIHAHRHTAVNRGKQGAKPSGTAGGDPQMRETLIFDVSSLGPPLSQEEFERMPKGETVEIDIEEDRPVPLLLAKHPFKISVGPEGPMFSGKGVAQCVLRAGRNVVGREAASDVLIDADYRDVSRKHLIIESDGQTGLRLTDISSHGTSIPPGYLDNTSI